MATASTLLTAIDDAIATILADPYATVKIGEAEYSRHNLDMLRRLRSSLKAEVADSHGSNRNYARF
ncbi:MAG TPA: hypothetical protein PK847_11905 [Candidatus Sumerlaeota bacterium]|nr:hypothetical protein [Candidatus Sumerlaeota bacterium]